LLIIWVHNFDKHGVYCSTAVREYSIVGGKLVEE